MYRTLLITSFLLYTVSLTTTIAGMETFSWLTFAIVVAGLALKKKYPESLSALKVHRLGPDWVVWGLFGTVALGVLVNGAPGINWVESLGSMRWILLMYAFLAALLYLGKISEKVFFLFLIVSGVVALNSILTSLTGYNIVRAEPAGYVTEGNFRGAGLFNLPTTYGHMVAMIACLSLSALFLKYQPFKGATWFFGLITGLSLLGLITSYTRASWISFAVALGLMAFLISRRLLVTTALAGALLFAALFATNEGIRQRITSIVDMDYSSNTGRLEMWRAHFAMFKDYPLLGIGLHDNERRNPEYNEKLGQPEAMSGHAHNHFLHMLTGTGVVGFTFFMLFVLYYFRLNYRLWQKREDYTLFGQTLILGILGAQLSFHISGLADANFKDTELNHLYILMLTILTAQSRGLLKKPQTP